MSNPHSFMQELQSYHTLTCYFLNLIQRKSVIIIRIYKFIQVFTQCFKYHADKIIVFKTIIEYNNILGSSILVDNIIEDPLFIFRIWIKFTIISYYLHSIVLLIVQILALQSAPKRSISQMSVNSITPNLLSNTVAHMRWPFFRRTPSPTVSTIAPIIPIRYLNPWPSFIFLDVIFFDSYPGTCILIINLLSMILIQFHNISIF